jgi:hypothetical protein
MNESWFLHGKIKTPSLINLAGSLSDSNHGIIYSL